MNIFTTNPGGYRAPPILTQRSMGPAVNITSKKANVTPQIGGSMVYGETRPGFKGEQHVYMKTDAGIVRANFAGPGTSLKERLMRGDRPINEIDRISKAHDLRYGLARDYDAVRAADNKMIAALENVKDDSAQAKIAKGILKSKIGLERAGLPRGFFAQHGKDDSATAMYQQHLAPLEQEGLGGLFPGTAGTDAYQSRKAPKFKKGSAEAKAHMASLRAMRTTKKQGKGLKLAGDGLMIAGSGKMAKKMIKKRGAQKGGLGFIALALPTLAGLAIKAAASWGISKGTDALINKIRGKGLLQAGSGMVPSMANIKEALDKHVSGPLKEQALKILESVRDKPELVEGAFMKLVPIISQIAQSLVGQAGGTARSQRLPGVDYSHEDVGGLEGPGFMQHVVDFVGKELLKMLKEVASGAAAKVFGGKGLIKNIVSTVNKAKDSVEKVIDKLPTGEAGVVRQIVSEIASNPAVLEDPNYLKSRAMGLTPMGQRLINKLLRSKGVPVQIAVNM